MSLKGARAMFFRGLQAAWSLFLVHVVTSGPVSLICTVLSHPGKGLEMPKAVSLLVTAVVLLAWILWLGMIFPWIIRIVWRRHELFPAAARPSRAGQ